MLPASRARVVLALALVLAASCGHDEPQPAPAAPDALAAADAPGPAASPRAQLHLVPLSADHLALMPFPAGSSVRWLDRALTRDLDEAARRARLVLDGRLVEVERETERLTLDVPAGVELDLLVLANDGEVRTSVAPLLPDRGEVVQVTLPPRVREVTGRLLRPDGAPLGEVTLALNGRRETWVGPDGAFAVTLPEPVARLEFAVDGWPPLELLLDPEGAERAPLEVRFVPGATLRARVRSADGTARPGVRVEALDVGSALTDPDGVATVVGVPPGREFRVRVRTNGSPSSLLLAPEEVHALAAGTLLEREYVLPPRGPIAGRLLDQAGRGLADVEVGLVQPPDEAPLDATYLDATHVVRRRAVTDAEGRFRFDDVDGERWLVGVAPGAWNARLPRAGRIAPVARPALPGEDEVELTTAARLQLVGRVVDERGEPVVRARVVARPRDFAGAREVQTQRDGGFTLKGLLPGPHDVWVEGELVREGLDAADLPVELRVELDRTR